MEPNTNPATRLRYFLEALQSYQPVHTSADAACANILKLELPRDRRVLLRRLADTADLVAEVRSLTEQLDPEGAKVLLADFSQVEFLVDQFTHIDAWQVGQLTSHMTDAGWRSTGLAEYLLKQGGVVRQAVLDADTVDKLLADTRDLISVILAAEDLDQAARIELLRRVRSVEEALLNVAVTGTVGVEQAAEGLFGHVLNKPPSARKTVTVRLVAHLAGAALYAAATAFGQMAPQLVGADRDQPPAVEIINRYVLDGHSITEQPAIESGVSGSAEIQSGN